jgi:uridylate kinase
MKTVVMSLGGSIIVPDSIDTAFLENFKDELIEFAKENRAIIVCGGGKTCRRYNKAAESISKGSEYDMDMLGIRATHLNAELVRIIFGKDAYENVLTDPTEKVNTKKNIIVAGGWKPGHSSDMAAIELAKTFGAEEVINISNIDYVYDKDPRVFDDAERHENLSWKEFFDIIGEEWKPGMNAPFDPIASKEAEKEDISVKIIGKDIDNIKRCIKGESFKGTLISQG